MAQYERIFEKPYEDGYENLPSQNTPITAQTLNDKDAAIEHIEDFLDGKEFPTSLADLSDDSTHRLVTDTEKTAWNGAVSDIDYYEQNGFLSKNLIPMTLASIKSLNTSGTWSGNAYTYNGVTFTVNTDNDGNVINISTSGTTTDGIYHFVIAENVVINAESKFNTGHTNPWSPYQYLCLAIKSDNTEYIPSSLDGITIPSGTYKIVIGIGTNINVNGKVFAPMIRLASVTESNFKPYAPSNTVLDSKKADILAIGTDESGRTTASRSYAQGEHFYKDGKFGKTKTAVAEGATWTLNTNYEEGTIADELDVADITSEITFSTDCTWGTETKIRKCGKFVNVALRFKTPSTLTSNKAIITFPSKYSFVHLWVEAVGTVNKQWDGDKAGVLVMRNQDVALVSNEWLADTNVFAYFTLILK